MSMDAPRPHALRCHGPPRKIGLVEGWLLQQHFSLGAFRLRSDAAAP